MLESSKRHKEDGEGGAEKSEWRMDSGSRKTLRIDVVTIHFSKNAFSPRSRTHAATAALSFKGYMAVICSVCRAVV